MRTLSVAVALLGLSSVVLGAYIEHSISNQSEAMINAVRAGLKYHQLYVPILLALCLFCFVLNQTPKLLMAVIFLFLSGIIFFSGSLYIYFFTGIDALVYITPVGGVILMIGWVVLIFMFLKLFPNN
jgi:uncharacterized membrane protein YgdD (TMEM256/DUF423 family)